HAGRTCRAGAAADGCRGHSDALVEPPEGRASPRRSGERRGTQARGQAYDPAQAGADVRNRAVQGCERVSAGRRRPADRDHAVRAQAEADAPSLPRTRQARRRHGGERLTVMATLLRDVSIVGPKLAHEPDNSGACDFTWCADLALAYLGNNRPHPQDIALV